MRLAVPLIAVALLVVAGGETALAQSPAAGGQGVADTSHASAATPGTGSGPAAAPVAPQAAPETTPHRHRRKLEERFSEANTTHDGHLTLEQAQAAHWKRVVENFQAIDHAHQGYVTLDDIHAFNKARRAAHHAAEHQAAPQPESK